MTGRIRQALDTLPPALRVFWLWTAALTAGSFVFTMTCTHIFHLSYPYGPPLYFAGDRWFDLLVFTDRFALWHTPRFWALDDYPWTYPAPLAIVYRAIYLLAHPVRWYLGGLLLALLCGATLLVRALVRQGTVLWLTVLLVASCAAASYPLRTLYESCNTEGLVAVLLALGVWAVLRDRPLLGATLIAVAGSLKLYPFVLLALLLSKRRYRQFAWGVLLAVALDVGSLASIGPTIAEANQHINAGLRYVKYTFIFYLRAAAVNFNHSLFTPVKYAVVLVERALHPIAGSADWAAHARETALLDVTYNIYIIAAALFGVAIYFLQIRKLPMLNQVFALTVCALLLPPLSADYTLVQMLFPMGLLAIYAADKWRDGIASTPGLQLAMALLAILCSFMTFLTLRFRFACFGRTIALCVLLWTVLRYPFPWRTLDSKPQSPGY